MITRVYDLVSLSDFLSENPIKTVAVEALSATYGLSGNLFSLYARTQDDAVTGILGVYGDGGHLTLSPADDGDEWVPFLTFLKLRSLTTDSAGSQVLLLACKQEGIIPKVDRAHLFVMGEPTLAEPDLNVCVTPDLRDVHGLMCQYLTVADVDSFVADMQARVNHGTGRAVTYRVEGVTAGTACVFFESGQVGFLGGISTGSRYRGRGIASSLVSTLCRDLLKKGKRPVLSCVNPAAERVYRSLGFTQVDEKITITF